MTVAVVKYNAGNIYSVLSVLQRLGVEPVLTDDPKILHQADKVIFPGQGEASNAMQYLRERGLDEVIRSLTQPVLGICIGQQLMCRHISTRSFILHIVFSKSYHIFYQRVKIEIIF